jgi:hypothetical protein
MDDKFVPRACLFKGTHARGFVVRFPHSIIDKACEGTTMP